ncbi:MAG: hypothetical protein H0T78_06060 [Longispora sp.]|nr:hypothetical protein [Longispora sp. (in: high G+C Gram-positive bacteria)]
MNYKKLVTSTIPVVLAALLVPGSANAGENDSVWVQQDFKGAGFSPLRVEMQCPPEHPRYAGRWKLATKDHVNVWFTLEVTRSPEGDVVLFKPQSYSPTTLWKTWKGTMSMKCATRF